MSWYKSTKGWIAAVLAAIWFVLDHWGRLNSAMQIYRSARKIVPSWASISSWIAPMLFAVALIFFELERRKGLKPKSHDLTTLNGRALQLCDEMQDFLDKAPKAKEFSEAQLHSMSEKEILADDSGGVRVCKLHHGYEVHFADRVWKIFNEFGERGATDYKLMNALTTRDVNREKLYPLVIERLTALAQQQESQN